MAKIVSIGAGTGQAAILKGLVQLDGVDITALVTTTDNGGSSAVIRESLGIPSPGDVRNVITAINYQDSVLSQLMNYRFQEGELQGVHLGNLIVGALSRLKLNYVDAIKSLNFVFDLHATVLPVSNHSTQVCAELVDGTHLEGERQIIKRDKRDVPVKRYYLKDNVPAVQEGLDAIWTSDMIIICAGVLGTGILSTLMFDGMRDAIKNSNAKLVYICNVMTYPSQTDGFSVADHLNLLEEYAGRPVDIALVHDQHPPQWILDIYAKDGSEFVTVDTDRINPHTQIIADNFLVEFADEPDHSSERASNATQHVGKHYIRHNGQKVADTIATLLP